MRRYRRRWADPVGDTARFWREVTINCTVSGYRRALTYPWAPKPRLFARAAKWGDEEREMGMPLIGMKRRLTRTRYFGSGGAVR